MKQNIEIAPLMFSSTDVKLLKQIWHRDYPDCASLEEVTRRLALKGISNSLRIRATFNVFKKMRDAGQTWDDIIQTLKKRDLEWEAIEKANEAKADVEAEAAQK